MTLKINGPLFALAFTLSACAPAAEDDGPPPPPPLEASGQAKLDQETTAPTPVEAEVIPAQVTSDNAAGERTAAIDWLAAKQDFDAQSGEDAPLVSVASADGTPPSVPILLPTGGPVSVASNGSGPRFKQTADGYYAVYKYENYDVIVNGTNEVIGVRPDGARDEALKFTATAAGAQVSLSRYGADYLIEFECYTINPQTGTCIEEDEAMGVAESLVIRGTRQ